MHLQIENIRTDAQTRIDAHSHIKSLENGFIGQVEARNAAQVLTSLIKQKKLAGRSVLFAGPSGTGKTAIALAIAKELGDVPFHCLIGSEVYSAEVKKSEVLMEAFRRSIGLRIKEDKEVFEGEVTRMNVAAVEGTGGQVVNRVNIVLQTKKNEQELKLDGNVYQQLQQQNVKVGDVIYIEANSGLVKRMGRSDKYVSDNQLEADSYVPVPKGDVHKRKEIVQNVTLHDLDMANAQPKGGQDLVSILNQFNKTRKTEITEKLRLEIDKVVQRYVQNGVAELNPGVLFIDECHLLDLESFSFLNKALESELAPICIFATNRGMCQIRGTEIISPHGIPSDLLDRMLIVRTLPYGKNEIEKIIEKRAEVESIKLQEAALHALGQIGCETSLRYSLQLISIAGIIAKVANLEDVNEESVLEARDLFLDVKRAQEVVQQQGGYLE
ncbi:TBP-interacting protein TIP49 [Spironucleus salmonicida]|uniref:RuvB-like helicase n=1 Tax=Spironucleus salmonicida TaxID=348837 RepID=V6LXT6_9EUKA|nr:TBP-interacting protein TIP49 [Spironucleus salmonicida]|eukprot:EST49365.1 TBP-interacting protein TIP49 [Spironucleus salmonicida]